MPRIVWPALLLVLLPVAAAAAEDPLVRAAATGDMAAVRALVTQGGHDVNGAGPDGATPLHWAVRADDLQTVDALLRAGARLDVRNALGVLPVYVVTGDSLTLFRHGGTIAVTAQRAPN